jgi:hypothetical protein
MNLYFRPVLRRAWLLLIALAAGMAYAEPIDRPVVQEKIHRHVEVDARGRYTETIERVSRIMNEFGADRLGRHTISHKSSQQTLKIVDAHITLPDGKVIRLAKDWIKHRRGGDDDSRSFGMYCVISKRRNRVSSLTS